MTDEWPLDRLSQLLDSLRRQGPRVRERQYAADSPLAMDLGAHPDFAERLGEGLTVSGQQLIIVEEHLGAAGACILEHGPLTPVYTLARVALECSGRVLWLVDQEVDGRTRASRAISTRIASIQESIELLPTGESRAGMRERREEVRQQAADLDLEVVKVESSYASARRAIGRDLGNFATAYLSAFTHGTPYALATLLLKGGAHLEDAPDELGIVMRQMGTSSSTIAMALAPGILGYLTAMHAWLNYTGLSAKQLRTLMERTRAEIGQHLPG